MAGRREGVDRGLRDWYTLVLRLRTSATLEIHLQPLAPVHFMDSDHLVRHSQKRQRHPTVWLFSNVWIHWEMLARDIHHAISSVDGGGHQGVTDRYSLDKVEDTQLDRHDYDLRVVVEPGRAGYDGHDNLDMRIRERFPAAFLTDPQRQCQRQRQCWIKWERGGFKHADSLWKEHFRYYISPRIPTADLGKRSGRAERRKRSTDAVRTRYSHPASSLGRSISAKLFDDEERRFCNVLVGKEGMVRGWVGGESIDWICCDVGFEFDVANRRGRVVG